MFKELLSELTDIVICFISGEELPPSTLELVQIYFDTATFDKVERDQKIKTEAQLSLIGGTMGLLTGFSIISGVEIIFYILRLIIIISSICSILHIFLAPPRALYVTMHPHFTFLATKDRKTLNRQEQITPQIQCLSENCIDQDSGRDKYDCKSS